MNKTSQSKVILMMAGGTGGHVFPALAVAHSLAGQGYEIHWLGTERGIESELVPKNGFTLHTIDIAGLRGKGKLGLLAAPVRIFKAVRQSLAVIKKLKPRAVVGLGGYATGPGGIAAWLKGIPLLVHEQNACAGMTNRILQKFARCTMQAFPGALPGALVTGNPVRNEVLALPAPELREAHNGKLRVLVVGGSLGAVALNQTVFEAMSLLPDAERPQLIHQAGKRNIDELSAQYQDAGIDADVTAFIDDMAAAYVWADLIVCRSGALTVSEIAAAGCAAIFVPFPFAVDDHQTANARYLQSAGAALIRQQNELSADWLAGQWRYFSDNKQALRDMAVTARSLAMTHATEMVTEQVRRFADEQ
ncbi:MAG: undecaprenyldiphospho-muramoylpentapeptide beta-N-acetylglucosaminyltransferase [Oceanospirillaceae bacterium]|nr:undecaprenyldiphospho-muramoylpentapeptide beta-N-acetylglucosaminyltransferase [Oceanospirillaceae bacterium]|tara:strand:+ start:20628 stop:21713 length:1086 start_codon:yes stop_codon:yes gene_type:complete